MAPNDTPISNYNKNYTKQTTNYQVSKEVDIFTESPTNDIILFNNQLYRKYIIDKNDILSVIWKKISYTTKDLNTIKDTHGTTQGLII